MRIAFTICAACLALTLSGCYMSQTHISVADGRSYKVYGNGVLLCEDSQDCKIGQRGTPNTLELEAVSNGKVVGRTSTKREITGASVFWGFFTYFITLYVYQAYPDNVYIPIDYSRGDPRDSQSSGDKWGASDWDKSPYSSGGTWGGAEPESETKPTGTDLNYQGPAADEY